MDAYYKKYHGIVNLSDKILTHTERTLLGRGLKFCPTPMAFDHGKVKEDLDHYFRSCNLRCFFDNKPSNLDDFIADSRIGVFSSKPFEHKDLKVKSTWDPLPYPWMLKYMQERVMEDFQGILPKKVKRNMSDAEYQAITSLKNDNSIVIKKADKGSNIVIQNTDDYITEGIRQLSNDKFYKEVPTDLTESHYEQVRDIVDSMFRQNQITVKTYDYLISGGKRTAIFYMLPKLHKNVLPPPGRPIVSSVECPTKKISKMLDLILNPLVKKTRSFIEDSTDFIRKIKSVRFTKQDWLVTMDVTSLYTNIPHLQGILAIQECLVENHIGTPNRHHILRMLNAVLKLNNFTFNHRHFLQINGTAMGTKVAPTYANLFMNSLEEKYIYTRADCPRKWFRFIDDVFMIFRGTEIELKAFLDHCNNIHADIKFTYEYSKTEVVFLDLRVYSSGQTIKTDLYTKPTNSFSYLKFDSCHHPTVARSIPYGEFLRLRRNCTEWKNFIFHSIQMRIRLLYRGYPDTLIQEALHKCNDLNRAELIRGKVEVLNNEKRMFFITEYNPTMPNLRTLIEKFWPILAKSSGTRNLLKYSIVYGFRKPRSILDSIVRADLPSNDVRHKKDPPRCNRATTCRHCPVINHTGFIKSTTNGRQFKCLKKVTCTSNNLIYCITCQICLKQYVGQTMNKLLIRINQHKSMVRTLKDTPVANHFDSHNIRENIPIEMHVLQLIREIGDKGKLSRNKWESIWMARLNSYIPNGLNILE
jgi:hypothetical protein